MLRSYDGRVQTIARTGENLRRASQWELRALRRIAAGLIVNLVLAFAWLLVDPLDYTARTKIPVIVVYFVTFVLADTVTTNMLADQAAVRWRRPTGLATGFGILLFRNLTLLLALGLPLIAATVALVALAGHAAAAPVAASSVLLQVLVWLGISSVLAALFPVTRASPLAWWRDRRDLRVTAWRGFALVVPYVLLWVLVPDEGRRRRLPGLGAVHRRTTGARPLDHAHQAISAVFFGAGLWLGCVAIGALVVRLRRWRPRA